MKYNETHRTVALQVLTQEKTLAQADSVPAIALPKPAQFPTKGRPPRRPKPQFSRIIRDLLASNDQAFAQAFAIAAYDQACRGNTFVMSILRPNPIPDLDLTTDPAPPPTSHPAPHPHKPAPPPPPDHPPPTPPHHLKHPN